MCLGKLFKRRVVLCRMSPDLKIAHWDADKNVMRRAQHPVDNRGLTKNIA